MTKVLFIACSPSMWEGFETLYLEHLNDPECVISVIPAIIYEKNKDGDGTNPTCEMDGYPEYLSLISLQDYNFEKERPDITYIQNAQDNDNLGMSLHPSLYTSSLKKYTKKLVYVPYTVYDESFLSDPYALEEMRPVILPPHIGNADQIIVQSENMKNGLIQLLAGDDESLKNTWDKKIEWENFPRTRLLQILHKEDIVMPDEWARHAYDADGNPKKIVLYCNAVSITLCEDRNALNKIKGALDYFKDNNSYCLLWRPHPKLSEILHRLRPYIADDYDKLLNYYITNDIGILDDSDTPTAAIVLSDLYYGDPCGTAELFKTTCKPIAIENMRRSNDDLTALTELLTNC